MMNYEQYMNSEEGMNDHLYGGGLEQEAKILELEKLYKPKYDFDSYHYPLGIEDDEHGHYIIFNINVTHGSKFENTYNYATDFYGDSIKSTRDANGFRQKGLDMEPITKVLGSGAEMAGNLTKGIGNLEITKLLTSFLSDETKAKVEAAGGKSIDKAVDFIKNSGKELNKSCRLVGNTKRLVSAIALYMPENLETKYSTNWTTTDLSSKSIDALKGIGGIFKGDVNGENLTDNLIDSLGWAIDTLSPFNDLKASDFLNVGRRKVRNPHLEFMFEGVNNREFNFTFDFLPKSEKEVELVHNIIHQFKFHAAPEIKGNTDTGSFFLYPSEFDISFWANGKENQRVNRISTCVLKDITVLYSADGGAWTTFRPDEKGSSPTHIRLSLNFTETELITKDHIDKGY